MDKLSLDQQERVKLCWEALSAENINKKPYCMLTAVRFLVFQFQEYLQMIASPIQPVACLCVLPKSTHVQLASESASRTVVRLHRYFDREMLVSQIERREAILERLIAEGSMKQAGAF